MIQESEYKDHHSLCCFRDWRRRSLCDTKWLKKLWIIRNLFLDLHKGQCRGLFKYLVVGLTISKPPTSSPSTQSWGKVGQSAYSFKPCLTSSSARILKNPYFTEFSRRSATNCLEKPHCGALGVPFMKSITGAAFTNDESLLCSASLSSFTSLDESSGAVTGS